MRWLLKRVVPPPLRRLLRAAAARVLGAMLRLRPLYYWFADAGELLLKRRDPLTPPKHLVDIVGGGTFTALGEEFRGHLVRLCRLQPHERVLDVGCGVGRTAVSLAQYLSREGGYEGFDIIPQLIAWCRRQITPRYPNFRFHVTDVFNRAYNRRGTYQASEFRFPFGDQSFDVVLLVSVFTHMLPADMENYLREVARVLRPGGRCLITFFLLNAESQELIAAGKSALDFRYQREGCHTTDEATPEAAVAYSQERIFRLCAECGLSVMQPIHYGSWCGRERYLSYQDIVVATRAVTGS